jgi:hypothetical protein
LVHSQAPDQLLAHSRAEPLAVDQSPVVRLEFKLKAVKLSQLPDVEVQAVADALAIHPYTILSGTSPVIP